MPDLALPLNKLYQTLNGWLESLIVLLPNLALAVVIVALALPVSRWVESASKRVLLRITGNDPISQLLATTGRVAALLVAVFFALGLLKLDKTVTSLLAGVGVIGLALGFAFQDIAANFMSGFMLAMLRPFKPGDLVEVGGHQGRVQRIAMRATELETLDGRSVLVPNKDIFQNPIVNYTNTPQRRLEFSVGTAYCDDMEHVQRTIIGALARLENRQMDREVEVLFSGFGDSSIDANVLVWLGVSDELSYRRAQSEAMIAIKRAFDREGITIPFPIRILDFGAGVVGGQKLDELALTVVSNGRTKPD